LFRREGLVRPVPDRDDLAREVSTRLAASGTAPSGPAVTDALRAVLRERGLAWEAGRVAATVQAIVDELRGFGPIGPLLRDPDVTEIMINAPSEVYVEKRGRIVPAPARLGSDDEILHLIERVVSPLGLRVDASSPWVDARLEDGSRFHAAVPPVTVRGPVVTIRKFSPQLWTLEELHRMGTLDEGQRSVLRAAVRDRRNVLVCGGTGTGKTTLLGVLARMIPSGERVITIEDAAELRLGRRHVVALETRPANVEGRGEVTMRDLVRCAMRMRPDRIVVGEVRGPEALDMLQALTSGHAGSMATVHADAPAEALMRLETLALLAAPGLSVTAARRQVGSAIDLIVHVSREAGHRRVSEIVEVRAGTRGPVVRRVTAPPRTRRTPA